MIYNIWLLTVFTDSYYNTVLTTSIKQQYCQLQSKIYYQRRFNVAEQLPGKYLKYVSIQNTGRRSYLALGLSILLLQPFDSLDNRLCVLHALFNALLKVCLR